jgi:hypothetical protein
LGVDGDRSSSDKVGGGALSSPRMVSSVAFNGLVARPNFDLRQPRWLSQGPPIIGVEHTGEK